MLGAGNRSAVLLKMIIKSVAVAGVSATALAACAAPTVSALSVHDQRAATIHTTKCGSCHQAPAPGSHTPTELESAFARHHKRVHLSNEEWQAMVDYLAAPDGKTIAQRGSRE